MHTELTAGLSCYPKDHVQFLSAAIVLFWLVGTPAHASDQREVDKVEGWSVIHDPTGNGSCYAKRTYGNETSLSIGKIAPHATWAAIVSNSTWSPIQTGTFYEIRYVFDKKK